MEKTKEITRAEELNKRGIVFIGSQQEEEGLKYFNKSIEEDNNYLEPYYNKAIVYTASEKFDKAIECYDIILKKDSKQGEAYFEKANVLFFNKNDIKAAVELYNKAIFLGIRNETIYYYLGLCAQTSGDMEDGLKWVERAIRINDKRADLLLKKAEILIALTRYIEAEKTYDKVLMLEADNEEAYHFKSIILGEQDKYEEAFKVLIDGEELIGKRVIFEYDKALIFEKQGKFKEALSAIEQGLEINAENTLLLEKQGSLLLLLEKGEDAKKAFDKISEIEPENMEGLFNKASACLLLQELEEALKIFESVIEKSSEDNPYKINSFYFKALILNRLGKVDEAKVAYDFALKNYNVLLLEYPYDAQLQLLKANTLRDLGRNEEAEEFYEYAIDLKKKMPEFYLNRAKNFILLGKAEEAKNAVEVVIELNPGYKAIIELDEDLKKCLNN